MPQWEKVKRTNIQCCSAFWEVGKWTGKNIPKQKAKSSAYNCQDISQKENTTVMAVKSCMSHDGPRTSLLSFPPSLSRWWLKDKSCLESNQVIGLKFSWVFRDCLGHNGKLIENLHLWDPWTLQLLIKYYCKVHKGSLWERFLSTSAFAPLVCGEMEFIFSTSSPKKGMFMIVTQLLIMVQ